MILIGAPRIVSGSATIEPTPLAAASPALCFGSLQALPGENVAQLGRDSGELSEFVVVRGVVRL